MPRSAIQRADAAAGAVGRALVRWGGLAATTIGFVSLGGWLLGSSALVQVRAGWPVTSAGAALALVIAGTAVELQRRAGPAWQPLRRGLGAVLVAGGIATTVVRTLSLTAHVDGATITSWQPGQATRLFPAISTALVVVAVGLVLAVGDARSRRVRHASYVVAVLSWVGLCVALLHYLGAETGGLRWTTPPNASLPVAVGLTLVWIPLASATVVPELSARFGRSATARLLFKRVVPLLVLVPPLVRTVGRAAEALGAEPVTAAALADIAVIVLIAGVLFAAGRTVDALQAERTRSNDLLAGVLGALHEGLVVRDGDAHVLAANPAADELLGVRFADDPTPRALIAAADLRDEGGMPLHPDELPTSVVRRTGRAVVGRVLQLGRDPMNPVWLRQTCVPFTDADGRLGTITTVTDVSFDHEMSLALSLAEERFRLAFEDAPVGMAVVRADGSFEDVNPALCQLMGRDRQQLLRTTFQEVTHPDDLEADLQAFTDLASGRRDSYRMDKRYLLAGAGEVWVSLHVSALRDAGGQVDRFLAQVVDLSERKALELQLAHAAVHDPLTGLPNRRLVEDRLEMALAAARREGTQVAVLFCDLDGFKAVNDTHGHAAGDDVLVAVADRLRTVGRDTDTVGRLGGDEFVVVAAGITDPTDAARLAERLRAAVEVPLALTDVSLTPRVSVGCHLADGDATATQALTLADARMYERKTDRELARADHR